MSAAVSTHEFMFSDNFTLSQSSVIGRAGLHKTLHESFEDLLSKNGKLNIVISRHHVIHCLELYCIFNELSFCLFLKKI